MEAKRIIEGNFSYMSLFFFQLKEAAQLNPQRCSWQTSKQMQW